MWWLVYGVAAAVLVGLPAIPLVVQPRTADVGPVGLGPLAMLSGGPGRVVDAVLVDLAEQGQVVAHEGLIEVAFGRDTHDVRLTAPSVIANAVAAHGPADLPMLRNEACRIGFVFEMEFNRLTEKRLAVSPLRREYAPAGWGLTALGTLFVLSFGAMSDHNLRAAVQGIAPESAWAWRSRTDAGVVESLACHLVSGTPSSP